MVEVGRCKKDITFVTVFLSEESDSVICLHKLKSKQEVNKSKVFNNFFK
jgi:hypothetical protein